MIPEKPDRGIPLAGMVPELRQLVHAIERRESLLLLGAAGSGKTKLIECAEHLIDGRLGLLPVPHFETLHDLLVILARQLLESGHQSLKMRLPGQANWQRWPAAQTSVHLKGLLWKSLEDQPCVLILDGVARASFPVYRFLQRLYYVPGMALVATARDPAQLGALGRLFWDPRRTIQLKPLSDHEASQLFERAIDHFGVHHLDLDEFREKVLDAAHGNPGQIVEMCRLVAQPQYVSGRYIKFGLLRIDARARYLG